MTQPLPSLADVATVDVYASLSLDGSQVLLPQRDIAMLELATDIQPLDAEQHSVAVASTAVGVLTFRGQPWPVYCLNDELRVVPPAVGTQPASDGRRMCAILPHSDGFHGVLCDAITTFDAVGLSLQGLPDCMQTDSSPVAALALQAASEAAAESVMTVTTAAHLAQLISNSQVHYG